jgi:hypothetical protein
MSNRQQVEITRELAADLGDKLAQVIGVANEKIKGEAGFLVLTNQQPLMPDLVVQREGRRLTIMKKADIDAHPEANSLLREIMQRATVEQHSKEVAV